METASATQVLGQFLLVSLLVERFIAVGAKLSTPKALDFAEDALDPPVDPWQSWTKTQLVAAAAVGFAICYLYKLDLFSSLFGPLRFDAELIGYFLTAIVIAGGSTAIQKILSAASAGAKALKSESLARIAESRARIKGVR